MKISFLEFTLPPNSTKLARFCKHLAIMMRERVAVFDGVSVTRPNCRGFKRANDGKNMDQTKFQWIQ